MKSWTDEEVALLIKNYNAVSNDTLLKILPNKSKQGIYKKAYKMGLRKPRDIELLNRSEARKRERSSNWNGGIRKTSKGYRQVLMPSHKRANKNGYVMEHIVVWERETGFPIPENCCIHHLNGNKSDNRIENLCLMKFNAHTVFHHLGKPLSDETKEKIRRKKLERNNAE